MQQEGGGLELEEEGGRAGAEHREEDKDEAVENSRGVQKYTHTHTHTHTEDDKGEAVENSKFSFTSQQVLVSKQIIYEGK